MGYQSPSSSSGGAPAALLFVLVLLYVAIAIVMVWAYVRIIRRAGYSGWWVLIGLVPLVNLVMLLVFAFREWPIQRELAQLRAYAAHGQGGYQSGYGHQSGYGYPPPGYPPSPGTQPW